jgi:hypothetical protein
MVRAMSDHEEQWDDCVSDPDPPCYPVWVAIVPEAREDGTEYSYRTYRSRHEVADEHVTRDQWGADLISGRVWKSVLVWKKLRDCNTDDDVWDELRDAGQYASYSYRVSVDTAGIPTPCSECHDWTPARRWHVVKSVCECGKCGAIRTVLLYGPDWIRE